MKLEESLPDDEEQLRAKDAKAIELTRSTLKNTSLTSGGFQTTILLEGEQQDISQLTTIRAAHQTRRATRSTKAGKTPPNDLALPTSSTLSQRHQICSQMADVIRRSGTGIERNVRWKSGSAPGTKGTAEVSQLSGNSANAELAAKERVTAVRSCSPIYCFLPDPCRYTQAAGLRARFFNNKSVHLSRYLVDGLVGNNVESTPPRLPLTAGCWGVVYSDERIFLGEGMCVERDHKVQLTIFSNIVTTFYSKEAGAGSKHGWQLSTTSISSLSYFVVRAYEGVGNCNSFRLIHSARANLRAHTFLHLPSTHFLCRTQDKLITTSSGMLSLSDKDWRVFREMVNCKAALAALIKQLGASMRGTKKT